VITICKTDNSNFSKRGQGVTPLWRLRGIEHNVSLGPRGERHYNKTWVWGAKDLMYTYRPRAITPEFPMPRIQRAEAGCSRRSISTNAGRQSVSAYRAQSPRQADRVERELSGE